MSKKKESKGFEFIIEEKDVLERENFGSFEVLLLKNGAMFKNYTGFFVKIPRYAVNTDGKACETSTYIWLENLIKLKQEIRDEGIKTIDIANITNQDSLDACSIMTETLMLEPMIAFVNQDEATEKTLKRLEYYNQEAKKLSDAMTSTPPEEDLKANAEAEYKAVMTEEAKEVFNETADIPTEKG